jgi:hypothetical protein
MSSSLPIDYPLSSPYAHNSGDRRASKGEPRMESQEDFQNALNLPTFTGKETVGDGNVSARQGSQSNSVSSKRALSTLEITSDSSASDDSAEGQIHRVLAILATPVNQPTVLMTLTNRLVRLASLRNQAATSAAVQQAAPASAQAQYPMFPLITVLRKPGTQCS